MDRAYILRDYSSVQYSLPAPSMAKTKQSTIRAKNKSGEVGRSKATPVAPKAKAMLMPIPMAPNRRPMASRPLSGRDRKTNHKNATATTEGVTINAAAPKKYNESSVELNLANASIFIIIASSLASAQAKKLLTTTTTLCRCLHVFYKAHCTPLRFVYGSRKS